MPSGDESFDQPKASIWAALRTPWPPDQRYAAGAILLIVITCAAYWPAMHGGFVMDDNLYLTANPLIKNPKGLYWFWFTTKPFDYWPITNTSFWLEWRIFGMDPFGYHLTNLVVHIASALTLLAILRRLAIPGAFLASLLFAIHPVNVQSVAWIAQRKNVLAMLFMLISALWYLREEEAKGVKIDEAWNRGLPSIGRWGWCSLFAFVLAMLSKGSVAVLPGLLLVLAWWQRGRIARADLVRTAPFFLVAVVLSVVNLWFQTHGVEETVRDVSIFERLASASAVVWFYLSKAFTPINLLFIYPRWQIHIDDLLWSLPLVAAAIVTAILVWNRHNSWARALLAAWVYFCVALVPVLGLKDIHYMQLSFVADHYQYIAIIGAVVLVAAGWSYWHGRARNAHRWATTTVAVGIVGGLAALTLNQSRLYADLFTLYEATLAKNPDCYLLQNNLGIALLGENRRAPALEHLKQALQVKPDYADAYNNLGIAEYDAGHLGKAIELTRHAIQLDPTSATFRKNLGKDLVESGQTEEAIEQLKEAVRLRPNYREAEFLLAVVLTKAGLFQDAIEQYQAALVNNPGDAEIHYNLAIALERAGKSQEAIDHYRQAISAKGDYPEAQNNLGVALLGAGQPQEAVEHFQDAMRLKPDYVEACANLAEAFDKLDRSAEAIATAQTALVIARAKGQKELVERIELWLKLHPREQPGSSGKATDPSNIPSAP